MPLVPSVLGSLLISVVSVALAVLIAVAAHADATMLAAAVAATVLALALGWGTLLGLEHARRTTTVVVGVSGLAGVALGMRTVEEAQPLAAFAGLMAGCVLLAFAHQLLRRDGRASLVESVTATLSGQVLAVLSAGWILLPSTRLGINGLFVAAAAAAATTLVVGLPIEDNLRGWAAFAAGAVVGAITTVVVAEGDLPATALVGVSVAAVAAGTALLLQTRPATRHPLALLTAAAGPVSAVGTVAYAVSRLAGG